MRSRLALLLTGALAVALVVSGVLVWRLVAHEPAPAGPAEVVVGESPGSVPEQPSDEDVVSPPPPVTGNGNGPAADPESESAPEREPAPGQEHVPDEEYPDDDQGNGVEDDCEEEEDDEDGEDDDDCEEDDGDDD